MNKSTLNHILPTLWEARAERVSQLRMQWNLPYAALSSIKAINPALPTFSRHTTEDPIAPIATTLATIPAQILAAQEVRPAKPLAAQPLAQSSSQRAEIPNQPLILEWEKLVNSIQKCSLCNLCHKRKNVVIERGSRQARWMLIGEGPSTHEDREGLPFTGPSGQLLDKMIAAMKLDPEQDVYICNVLKCRPENNRNPEIAEIEACNNYLSSQIALVKPQIIITLGRYAAQTMLGQDVALSKLRGTVHNYSGIPLIVTYHPTYLLRTPDAKKDAWDDLQLALKTNSNYIPSSAKYILSKGSVN